MCKSLHIYAVFECPEGLRLREVFEDKVNLLFHMQKIFGCK